MRLRFSAVCDDARATSTGRIDLHGVYHDLAAPGFPAKQDRLVLVLVLEWNREDHGRYRFKADLQDEEGNVSLTVEGETEVHQAPPDQPPARSQLIMPMEDVIFPRAGQYTFHVRVKGRALEGPGIYLMEVPEEQASQA
ncbi:MAG: hypothetical protein R3304_05760 [Longimicrobiales bacterium]|nr:hypothetical protein [Longimicrobiales bacterium]